jgi:penicillin-binding protein 1C
MMLSLFSGKMKITPKFIGWFVLASVGTAIVGLFAFIASAWLTPLPNNGDFSYPESMRILDRKGRLLREAVNVDGVRAEWVGLHEISPWAVKAVIAVEDERFLFHDGVDPIAIIRAVTRYIPGGDGKSGASTIAMQLARMLFSHPRNFTGKLHQSWDALRLVHGKGKDWVLEQYLNRAPFGSGCVGIGAAARRFFGKPAGHLSLAEAALLVGIPQSPSTLDPLKFPAAAERRRLHVLDRFEATRKASSEELAQARTEVPRAGNHVAAVRAGHYTDYVLSLKPARGTIITTLDIEFNDLVQSIVSEHVSRLGCHGLTNAAAIVLDNRDGTVLAMVGSRDWFQPGDGSVNGALARRQPGSALKPFVYALAFSGTADPGTVLADVETEYYGTDRILYIPKNYSLAFRGPVTAKEALAMSLNVPAIRLAARIGLPEVLASLKELGFTALDQEANHYGLGLVLGNGEVSLLELASAYSILARNGVRIEASPFRPENSKPSIRVLDERSCWMVTSILADERLRVQTFGTANPLLFGFPMAVKTGTSNEWRDAWSIGYTRRYTLAVWAGDFSAKPMDHISGSAGAGTILARIANILRQRDPSGFTLPEEPPGLVGIQVCAESGQAPGPYCGRAISVFVKEGKKLEPCSVHKRVPVDIRTGKIAGSDCPRKYVKEQIARYLPPIYNNWLKAAGYPLAPQAPGVRDVKSSDIAIKKPRNGDTFIIEPGYDRRTQTIEFAAAGPRDLGYVEWLVDGKVVSKAQWPFDTYWKLKPGVHRVSARSVKAESAEVVIMVK